MEEDFKEVVEQINQEVKNMRDKASEYGKDSAEFKSYMEKADVHLKQLDDIVEVRNKEIEKQNDFQEEQKTRIEHLEQLLASNNKSVENEETPHDVMSHILAKNWNGLAESNQVFAKKYLDYLANFSLKDVPEEGNKARQVGLAYKADQNIVRSDINELGGWLCPDEWATELDRIETEYTPIRNYARIMRISGKKFNQPVIDGRPIAYFEGETKPVTPSAPSLKFNQFTPYREHVKIPFTKDVDMNNAYEYSRELVNMAAFAFAEKEGLYCTKGDGVKKPSGWTLNSEVIENAAETETTTLTIKDIIKMSSNLKNAYSNNAIYCMNRKTLNFLRVETDGYDRYLINVDGNASAAFPPTINGYRYSADFVDMDDYDVASGYPIILADWKRFYRIIDRTDVMMVINPWEALDQVTDMYNFFKWMTGGVELAEAGIALKRKA